MVTTASTRLHLPKPYPHVFHPYNLRSKFGRDPGPVIPLQVYTSNNLNTSNNMNVKTSVELISKLGKRDEYNQFFF
jgi:hypothetical protein